MDWNKLYNDFEAEMKPAQPQPPISSEAQAINQRIERIVKLGMSASEVDEIVNRIYAEGDQLARSDEQQAYRHSWDQQHFFYYHHICVERNPPGLEVTFDLIPLSEVPQEAECDFCYKPVHGKSAYYTAQDEVQA